MDNLRTCKHGYITMIVALFLFRVGNKCSSAFYFSIIHYICFLVFMFYGEFYFRCLQHRFIILQDVLNYLSEWQGVYFADCGVVEIPTTLNPFPIGRNAIRLFLFWKLVKMFLLCSLMHKYVIRMMK